jgi:RNA polymerase sigma factor (sigma-70 family)
MKVKFMVKCEAVHEGLSLELDRAPTIAEWAAACGFDKHDKEMCSENYEENDLDRQIRPSGSEADELDPNMFVGNGLVNDSGVGRGKGRVKKPPPMYLGKFYDDSFEKFKGEKTNEKSDGSDVDTQEDELDIDIFLRRQMAAPGEPINRGSPRVFREMMLTAKEAKQRMVQCNMRLVVSIARRYHGVGVNVQDLVQEGSLGLARAAEKFDPKKGFKFSTYASWWIQQAVFRSIAYHSRTIRLPVHVHNLLNKVRRARQILQQELGRMPTNDEMAEEMDMSIEKYNKMIRNTRQSISLETPKYKNNPKDYGHESEALVGDMVDSTSVIFDEKTPEQTVDHGLLHSDIQFMLGKLGEDERKVLCLRYGINDGITRTVTLVASEMRQTKSWVRSQECRALRKMRRPWYEKRLKEHRLSLQASLPLPIR